MPVEAAAGLAALRGKVDSACRSLVEASPESLRRCEDQLQEAVGELRSGRTSWDWKSSVEAARKEAAQLQSALRRAGRLLSIASRYHASWLRIVSAMTVGYSSRGEVIPVQGLQRISLQG